MGCWGSIGSWGFIDSWDSMRFMEFLGEGGRAQKLQEVLIKICCVLRFKGYQSDFSGQFANLIPE